MARRIRVTKKVLVTGGAGFIGSNFVRSLLREPYIHKIVILDKLTYAGSVDNLDDIIDDKRIEFIKGDIADEKDVRNAMIDCDWVVNFAAESHVDRSLSDSSPFIKTNVDGVRVLLETARELKPERFLQISTDEVYGSIKNGSTNESAPILPSSPYSASKAAADFLAHAYMVSFDVPILIARSSNNYGEYQYPEKLIPRMITLAMQNKPLPIYGDGKNIRDWLYVRDNCRALLTILRFGKYGETYNIGSSEPYTNIEIATLILELLNKPHSLLVYVPDRPGHDRRYSVDWSKIAELGWAPKVKFDEAFITTVKWYVDRADKFLVKSSESERFYKHSLK
jgi:dTDP-glucose 4,6-dehydratase